MKKYIADKIKNIDQIYWADNPSEIGEKHFK
jgi:hypothetical protein